MTIKLKSFYVFLLVGLSGCSFSPQKTDGPPPKIYRETLIEKAIPRVHKGVFKTSPYEYAGRVYQPLETSSGYDEEGIASWYGTKFHGQNTANGERYSMYTMTAAHRTLPLPTYVRVTNLANNRSVIVRVNDRGPFHQDRLIDLSWAAARKLGYSERGTARVRVVAINPKTWLAKKTRPTILSVPKQKAVLLQLAALKSKFLAERLRQRIGTLSQEPVAIQNKNGWYRVQLGPITSAKKLHFLKKILKKHRFDTPILVRKD